MLDLDTGHMQPAVAVARPGGRELLQPQLAARAAPRPVALTRAVEAGRPARPALADVVGSPQLLDHKGGGARA